MTSRVYNFFNKFWSASAEAIFKGCKSDCSLKLLSTRNYRYRLEILSGVVYRLPLITPRQDQRIAGQKYIC